MLCGDRKPFPSYDRPGCQSMRKQSMEYQGQLKPSLCVSTTDANSAYQREGSIGVTWSGLLWYKKLKRCPMVTHSSKSSFSGRACSRAASTWTQRWLWPRAPHPPRLPGPANASITHLGLCFPCGTGHQQAGECPTDVVTDTLMTLPRQEGQQEPPQLREVSGP